MVRGVAVEGRPTFFQVSDAGNNCCSAPGTTHVVVNNGPVWCYDNTSKVEVVA